MDEQEQREREAAKKELLEGDIGELAMTLILAGELGPTQHLVPASLALLFLGKTERAKGLLQEFLDIFENGRDTLKQGVEYELAVQVHRNMADPAKLQPMVDLCRELGIIVRMPDPGESAVIFV